MMITTFDHQLDRNSESRRAARLAMLRQQVVLHIMHTDASAQRVEEALGNLAKATAVAERLTH